jgi:hypothetical protein
MLPYSGGQRSGLGCAKFVIHRTIAAQEFVAVAALTCQKMPSLTLRRKKFDGDYWHEACSLVGRS